MSLIMTEKEQPAWLLAASYAVQVMVVEPKGNVVSLRARLHETRVTPTLSNAVPALTDGAVKTTTPVLWPVDV